MIGLGQESEIEEITLQPEIWGHDAAYHEAGHCMKWPYSVNVRILWSRPAKGAVILWMFCLKSFTFLKPSEIQLYYDMVQFVCASANILLRIPESLRMGTSSTKCP